MSLSQNVRFLAHKLRNSENSCLKVKYMTWSVCKIRDWIGKYGKLIQAKISRNLKYAIFAREKEYPASIG
jgi:hypothetical protein